MQKPAPDKAMGELSEPPYMNDEPEKYQTYVLQATSGETVKFFAARDGDKWRIDSAYGTPTQTGSLHTDKDYVLAFAQKSYGEYESAHGFDERPNMVQEITHGMLNARDKAVFETLSSAGGVTRYRAIDANGKEAVITFDETKKIPVKKEIFNTQGGVRKLEITISLEEFTTDVDAAHFEIPKGFKKVPRQEIKNILMAK